MAIIDEILSMNPIALFLATCLLFTVYAMLSVKSAQMLMEALCLAAETAQTARSQAISEQQLAVEYFMSMKIMPRSLSNKLARVLIQKADKMLQPQS